MAVENGLKTTLMTTSIAINHPVVSTHNPYYCS